MANEVRVALPADIVSDNAASVTVTAGVEDGNYPVLNLIDGNPAKPGKLTGTSGTIRFHFSSAQALVAVALINHNLQGATVSLTNPAGLNQSITIPSYGADDICINPFKDFTGAAFATDDDWDLVIAGASNPIAIGDVILTTALRELPWLWGVNFTVDHDVITHYTFGGTRLQYDKLIRVRRASGVVIHQSEESTLRGMDLQAHGSIHPILLIPKNSVNDAWLVQMEKPSFTYVPETPNTTRMQVEFREISMGPPLFA